MREQQGVQQENGQADNNNTPLTLMDHTKNIAALTGGIVQIGGGIIFSPIAPVAISSGISTTIYAVQKIVKGKKVEFTEYAQEAVIGGATGLVSFGTGTIATQFFGTAGKEVAKETSKVGLKAVLETAKTLGKKLIPTATTNLASSITHDVTSAIVHQDKKYLEEVTPTKLLKTALTSTVSVIGQEATPFVSKVSNKLTEKVASKLPSGMADKLLKKTEEKAKDVVASRLKDVTNVAMEGLTNAATAAASTGGSKMAKNIYAKRSLKGATEGVTDEILIATVVGAVSGVCSATNQIKQRQTELPEPKEQCAQSAYDLPQETPEPTVTNATTCVAPTEQPASSKMVVSPFSYQYASNGKTKYRTDIAVVRDMPPMAQEVAPHADHAADHAVEEEVDNPALRERERNRRPNINAALVTEAQLEALLAIYHLYLRLEGGEALGGRRLEEMIAARFGAFELDDPLGHYLNQQREWATQAERQIREDLGVLSYQERLTLGNAFNALIGGRGRE